MYKCKQCGKEFSEKYSKWSDGNFCCKECARKYSSQIKRQDIIKKLKIIGEEYSQHYKEEYYKNPKLCQCGKMIPYERRKRKSCCNECGKILKIKNNLHKHDGGYRQGSARSHHGWYKGYWCDSTYELAYLIYNLDHNISIERCSEIFEYINEGKKHTYHPDFIVNSEIIEIKGYHNPLVDAKAYSVNNKHYRILYKNDLTECFDYVAKTYNKRYVGKWNNFYELYDNYKPKYEYICDECGKTFTRDIKKKSEHTFCSRHCSGIWKSKRNILMSVETKKKISESLKNYYQSIGRNIPSLYSKK